MKIAVIGAGAAGLAAIKHAVDYGFLCDAFEQTDKVGGTWNYTDLVGVDENGLPVHSSMYKGLITNIPKEVMEYEDFHYPKEQKLSYISQQEVLGYISDYALHYKLHQHIKFNRFVTKVAPTESNQWQLTTADAKTKLEETGTYDAVMVCNGHYRDPFVPSIKGQEIFKGRQWHSHDYRSPETFQGKNVLILGAGPSGTDIAFKISKVAKKVYLSHKLDTIPKLPLEIEQKCGIAELTDSEVIFEDSTKISFDEILYCTGYKFNFPFLTKECGIVVEENWVQPLYKHVININNPTMCFIGIPFTICPFPMFDLQVKFFLSTLTGHFKLPSPEDMRLDLHNDITGMVSRGVSIKRHAHKVGEDQEKYFNDLADTANIKRVPSVIHKLYLHVRANRNITDCYEIVDDENFVVKDKKSIE